MEKSGKYCFQCGQPTFLFPDKTFNPLTGRRRNIEKCMNIVCPRGCKNNGGHIYGFFRRGCLRCGNVISTSGITG